MVQGIILIELKLPYRMGSVNCYLVKTNTGFILVDTGSSNKCRELDRKLEQSGCNSGNLKLIILTHGDFDHTGNASYIKKKHNLIIGDQSAEDIKIKLGSATKLAKGGKYEISGRDLVFGLPRSIEITSNEITEAIRPPLLQIIGAVKAVLENTPPELASDIIDKGIVMSGGTSLLRNFDKLMTEETGVPAHVADDALYCVVRGTGMVLENIELWKRSVTTKR